MSISALKTYFRITILGAITACMHHLKTVSHDFCVLSLIHWFLGLNEVVVDHSNSPSVTRALISFYSPLIPWARVFQ